MIYICPGCLFLGKENPVTEKPDMCFCLICEQNTDEDKKFLCKTFSQYNKKGVHCPECNRFIPNSLNEVLCPYLDCCFIGFVNNCNGMRHPAVKDVLNIENKKTAYKCDTIQDVIKNQMMNVYYHSSEFTVPHKKACYQAFLDLLEEYPEHMTKYLHKECRTGGFQHKIFQKYISILEKALPFSYKKNGKFYKIESLLDEDLCIFDGISTFETIVSNKLEIKNATKEFYIGGRSASYTKPFYIGKVLSISDQNNVSLMDNIQEYTFSKIKMKGVSPGDKVKVVHLRIPPHYQMGGMTHVNRVRKAIVEQLCH